ncbi:MAG: 2,3-dihydroxybenzoate-AMP ligase [Micrococcales bacterium 32-70-13]|nr:MAG: 2,3-dihydroxybenzoate-AMP ligase [Micrococcales bacterium 32-70-13]
MIRPTREGVVAWPKGDAARYREAGYWTDEPLYALIAEAAARRPEAIAVVDSDVRVSYDELLDRADGAATRLLELGLSRDDRVLVQLPNTWEFVAVTLACMRIGVIPVMALPAHRSHELSYLAELSESVAVFVPDAHRDFDHQALGEQLAASVGSMRHVIVLGDNVRAGNVSLVDVLKPCDDRAATRRALDEQTPLGDDPVVFLLSGGTTGLPKLITRTHNDYAYNIRVTSAATKVDDSVVYLVALPAGHNFPLACPGFLGALAAGGRVVITPSPEPIRCFEIIEREKVTMTAVVPAVAQRWIEHQEAVGGDSLRSLRVLQVGGSRLVDELARKVRPILGATLQQVFGMAEGLINMTRLDDDDEIIESTQGRPVSEADEVTVVDESGTALPPGSVGVLLTRGPYTPRGYYRADEHNARSFTADGWYISGDIVELRLDGNLVVRGRDKDMINRGGEKVSGEEVENFVYRFPEVALAAAIAVPDPLLGERVCVCVVLKPGGRLELDQIRAEMSVSGVAAYKLPERLEVIDEMPMTKIGKIDKRALREQIAPSAPSA